MKLWQIVLLIGLVCGIFLSPFASSHPNGLEKVAEHKEFINRGVEEPMISSPIPDYVMPGIENESIAVATAGFVGTLLVFVVTLIVAKILEKPKSNF